MPPPSPRVPLLVHILCLLFVIVVGAVGIGLKVHATILAEAISAVAYVFAVLLTYYWFMIYRGVRYDNGIVQWRWQKVSVDDVMQGFGNADFQPPSSFISTSLESLDLGENLLLGILALLGMLLLWFIVMALLGFLVLVGVNVAGFSAVFAWIPLYISIKYGIRLALVNAKSAKGRLLRSGGLAALHALLGSLAMGVVFLLTELLVRKMAG